MDPYDPEHDHYTVLGVPSSSTADQIKRVYREKVLLVHPDGHRVPELAGRELQRLNDAYAVLGDPPRRRVYDEQRGGYLRRELLLAERDAAPAPARTRKKPASKKPAARKRKTAPAPVTFDALFDSFGVPSIEQLFAAAFGKPVFDFGFAPAPARRRRRS